MRRASTALEARVNHGLREQSLALSVLTRAELRFGQAAMEAQDRRRRLIDLFLLQLPCLPWTSKAADAYGTLEDALRRAGRPIGELDTLIAAHALAEGLTLVTHNVRHFADVAGLDVQDWMLGQDTLAKGRPKSRPPRA